MNRAQIERIAGMACRIFELEKMYWGRYGAFTFANDDRVKPLRRHLLSDVKLLKLDVAENENIDPREWVQTAMDALRIRYPESEPLIQAAYLLERLVAAGSQEDGEQYLAEIAGHAKSLLGDNAGRWLSRLRFPMSINEVRRAQFDLVEAEYRRQSAKKLSRRSEVRIGAARPDRPPTLPSQVDRYRGKVDFVIVTIKPEEFGAVQKRLEVAETISGRRDWNICRVFSKPAARETVVATVRQIDQGTNEAYGVVSDAIEDLDPAYILVVGIAGAIPGELTLGDVVFGKHIHDLTVQEVKADHSRVFSIKGGGAVKGVQVTLANLAVSLPPALLDLALPTFPGIDFRAKIHLDKETAKKIRTQLRVRYGAPPAAPKHPHFTDGEIASSDTLVKDIELVDQWRMIAKHVSAVEMESAGAYRASRTRQRQYPVIPIRAISDVIGLERDQKWTVYACDIAAAFALAFIGTLRIQHWTD